MVGYKYKIQWMFDKPRNAYAVLRAIGAKSLDIIYIRDARTGKVLDSYDKMMMHPYGVADDEAVKFIRNATQKHFGNIAVKVELLRR